MQTPTRVLTKRPWFICTSDFQVYHSKLYCTTFVSQW
jgi:hypothetical protein